MQIGSKIRELRKSKNLTQKELGNKIGLSEQAISQYERNERKPNIEILNKIAEIFGTTLNDLLTNMETLSKKLINKLQYPLLQIYGVIDTLEILSNKIDVDYDILDNSLNNDIELPVDIQIKLLELLSKLDNYECIRFIDKNEDKLRENPKLESKVLEILSSETSQLKITSFEMFRQYLFTIFGDKIKEFSNESKLVQLQEEVNKYLEFALFKMQKEYYGKDD